MPCGQPPTASFSGVLWRCAIDAYTGGTPVLAASQCTIIWPRCSSSLGTLFVAFVTLSCWDYGLGVLSPVSSQRPPYVNLIRCKVSLGISPGESLVTYMRFN